MSGFVKSSMLNGLIKPVGVLLSLVYTPLLLRYLGEEKYGLWATILTVTSWITYFDVGIGHGLRNILTTRLEEKNMRQAQKAVSTAYICLTAISVLLLVVLCILTFSLDWYTVFNTTIDMRIPLFISFVFICVNFVLALCNTLLYAIQKSEIVSLVSVLMQVINILGLLMFAGRGEGNLVYMALLFGGSTTICYLVSTVLLIRKRKELAPRVKDYDKTQITSISGLGLKFFVIQVTIVLTFTVENLLITRFFGAAALTPYSVLNKVFSTGLSFFTALILPVWSGATSAIARHDYVWLKKAISVMNRIAVVFMIGYIVVALLFERIAAVWLGESLVYPDGLILTVCLYHIFYTFSSVYNQVNNGIGAINGQIVLGIIQALVSIPLSIFLAINCNMGVLGIKATTTFLVLAGMIFHFFYYHRSMRSLQGGGITR